MTRSRHACALLAFLPSLAWGQANLTGYWKFSVPDGGTSFLRLQQAGENLTGSTRGGQGWR